MGIKKAKALFFASVTAVVLAAETPGVYASEKVLHDVAIPQGAEIKTVALNLVQNGHRMSIANLDTSLSTDAVMQFYREQWKEPLDEGVPGFVENNTGGWSIISRPDNGWNQVVQVRNENGKIDGRISVMELASAPYVLPTLPMPSGASLVTSTGADDVGHSSSTYVVVSTSGVSSLAGFYRRHFDQEGWSRVSDKNINNTIVMLLQKSGERAELVVSRLPNGGSMALVNKVLDDV